MCLQETSTPVIKHSLSLVWTPHLCVLEHIIRDITLQPCHEVWVGQVPSELQNHKSHMIWNPVLLWNQDNNSAPCWLVTRWLLYKNCVQKTMQVCRVDWFSDRNNIRGITIQVGVDTWSTSKQCPQTALDKTNHMRATDCEIQTH